MNVTEPERHHLYELAKSGWDENAAETLMNLLPPVGWADVATKHDIAALRNDLTADIAALRHDVVRLERRMDHIDQRMDRLEDRFDRLEARLDVMQTRFVTWLLTSQATVVVVMVALATLTR